MKKRIASLLMAVVMLASLGVGSLAATTEKTLVQGNNTGLSAANFKDLADATKADGRHWAWDAIDHVVKFGLFNGTSATTFAPQNGMTRAQFVVVITRLENTSRSAKNKLNVERVPTKTRFTDVPEDMWCAGAVAWAEANGIVEGYSDNTFKPNQVISRAQIAAFVYRYVNNYKKYNLKVVKPEPAQFTDFADAHQVFQSAIDYCRTHGLIQGYGDHSLKPNIAVTRAQVAAILSRIIIVLTSGRGGGGGGGGGGLGASAFTMDTAGFGNWAAANFGVKFVATYKGAADAAATGDTYGTAVLSDNGYNTQTLALASGTGATAAYNNNGFTLSVTAKAGYSIESATAYYDPATVANAITGAGAVLLNQGTEYTWAKPAASMTKDQFDTRNKVTVVVEFVDQKLEPTNVKFIALDAASGTESTAVGTASVKMYTSAAADAAVTLTSGGTVTQKLVNDEWQGMEMTALPADGYEIESADDFRVFNTSASAWDNGAPQLDGSSFDLIGNTVAMDKDQLGTYTSLTVVVKFTKSEYQYKMKADMDVVSGVGLHLDTTKSFTDNHWLAGGTPIKDAARLMIDDGTSSTDNPLNSDENSVGNVYELEGTIDAAMSKLVVPMLTADHEADAATGEAAYKGFKKDVTNMGKVREIVGNMVSSKGADALKQKLTAPDGQNMDNDILNRIDTNAIITSVQTAMFNAIAGNPTAIGQAAGAPAGIAVTIDPKGFVDSKGNVIPATAWGPVGTADFAITMSDSDKLTGSDLTFTDVDQIAVILTAKSDYIEVSAEVTGLDVTLKSLKGSYNMTVSVPDLYVIPVVGGTAGDPVAVNSYLSSPSEPQNGVTVTVSSDKKSLTLSGSLADVNLGSGVLIQDVEKMLTGDMELPMKDLLFEDGGYVKDLFERQKEQLRDAVKNTGANKNVMNSLEENILNLVAVETFVDQAKTTNDKLYLKQGILAGSGAKYRTEVIREFYDGFWKVHAKLFTEYPNDQAMRQKVLDAVVDWFAAKTHMGTGKADALTSLLAKEQRPTIASLYKDTMKGTFPAAGSTAVESQSRPTSGTVSLPGSVASMASSAGIGVPSSIPATFTIQVKRVAAPAA